MEDIRLNLGCGAKVVGGWTNVDYAFGARVAKIPVFSYVARKWSLFNLKWDKQIYLHDLTKPFPWFDCSVSVIYSSHTLEHMSREEGAMFLRECHRVLCPNGIIRIVVPDLQAFVKRYIDKTVSAEYFLDELGVLKENQPKNTLKKLLWTYIGYPHKCMYDSESLVNIMYNVGFIVTSKKYADSQIADIVEIESEYRTTDAVVVEGRKI